MQNDQYDDNTHNIKGEKENNNPNYVALPMENCLSNRVGTTRRHKQMTGLW
jgi:hypothetical protein